MYIKSLEFWMIGIFVDVRLIKGNQKEIETLDSIWSDGDSIASWLDDEPSRARNWSGTHGAEPNWVCVGTVSLSLDARLWNKISFVYETKTGTNRTTKHTLIQYNIWQI